jgi:hypothetical protein
MTLLPICSKRLDEKVYICLRIYIKLGAKKERLLAP